MRFRQTRDLFAFLPQKHPTTQQRPPVPADTPAEQLSHPDLPRCRPGPPNDDRCGRPDEITHLNSPVPGMGSQEPPALGLV
ncbi:hypothetical protein H920_02707 [Fukomys damarensis]|uniref:Uncharacterized protein n=1 Tax=Fukomys damarensis TaxID=885580 RepID=A0A091DZX5_FUKDA|nr:hypothetical protein H920_02707 [Fukomys damarensis]